MSKLTIRHVEESDISQLVELFPTKKHSSHLRRYKLATSGVYIYVLAVYQDEIVGVCACRMLGFKDPQVKTKLVRVPELRRLIVNPNYRGQGIGTKLIAFIEDELRDQGIKTIGLSVLATNTHAKRLYERLGYKDWGHGLCTVKNANGESIDRYTMTKEL